MVNGHQSSSCADYCIFIKNVNSYIEMLNSNFFHNGWSFSEIRCLEACPGISINRQQMACTISIKTPCDKAQCNLDDIFLVLFAATFLDTWLREFKFVNARKIFRLISIETRETSPLLSLFRSLLFHAGQAAIKLPSAEASKRAQCTSPGQYAPYIKVIMKTP